MNIAIAQMPMAWTTAENTQMILNCLQIASDHQANICVFPELAITGFHRRIREEAKPEVVTPALERVREACSKYSIAAVVGTPTFRTSGAVINAVEYIDRNGNTVGFVEKIGITPAEATFLEAGRDRPILHFEGLRSTAIICREAHDHERLCNELASETLDVIFWPGAMRPDPENPGHAEHHIDDACELAKHTRAYVIQSNWPESLNYPEDTAGSGHSVVISPLGEIMFRLPKAAAGVGIFEYGKTEHNWIGS